VIGTIYKIGQGPSSSHSMGPRRAAEIFAAGLDQRCQRVQVELFGSLAATGKGHLTDRAIRQGLAGRDVSFIWHMDRALEAHPNGMVFTAVDADGKPLGRWQVYSIGGGDLRDDKGEVPTHTAAATWQCESLSKALASLTADAPLWQYVHQLEGDELWPLLGKVWAAMKDSVGRGLASTQSQLPGRLHLARRAARMREAGNERVGFARDLNLLSAYALAVAEENAAGGIIVTAPTCGSAGVLPAVLYYFQRHHGATGQALLEALATAGLIGHVAARRASISGAEVGCQGEIGVACSMASAAAAQLMGASQAQVEYAAEMGLEHWLGLTCDPIAGLVQVPCIERNAFAAMRAIECGTYALSTDGRHLVSFDDVVDVMNATGRDLQAKYRETATGGLAAIMRNRLDAGGNSRG
jgi:L-serine dehydratase